MNTSTARKLIKKMGGRFVLTQFLHYLKYAWDFVALKWIQSFDGTLALTSSAFHHFAEPIIEEKIVVTLR